MTWMKVMRSGSVKASSQMMTTIQLWVSHKICCKWDETIFMILKCQSILRIEKYLKKIFFFVIAPSLPTVYMVCIDICTFIGWLEEIFSRNSLKPFVNKTLNFIFLEFYYFCAIKYIVNKNLNATGLEPAPSWEPYKHSDY